MFLIVTCCKVYTFANHSRSCGDVDTSQVYNPLDCTYSTKITGVHNVEDEEDGTDNVNMEAENSNA